MRAELIGADLSPSSGVGGGVGWSEFHLECVHRQITFVVYNYFMLTGF